MKTRTTAAVLTAMLMVSTAPVVRSQQSQVPQSAQSGPYSALTEQERAFFESRLRAAQSDQERAQILAERNSLVQQRSPHGDLRQIPPSPSERADDPIMSGVPTPRSNPSWPYGTLPGGALAPTGTGTGPSTTTGGWSSDRR